MLIDAAPGGVDCDDGGHVHNFKFSDCLGAKFWEGDKLIFGDARCDFCTKATNYHEVNCLSVFHNFYDIAAALTLSYHHGNAELF